MQILLQAYILSASDRRRGVMQPAAPQQVPRCGGEPKTQPRAEKTGVALGILMGGTS
jgi:hypothetical protein